MSITIIWNKGQMGVIPLFVQLQYPEQWLDSPATTLFVCLSTSLVSFCIQTSHDLIGATAECRYLIGKGAAGAVD